MTRYARPAFILMVVILIATACTPKPVVESVSATPDVEYVPEGTRLMDITPNDSYGWMILGSTSKNAEAQEYVYSEASVTIGKEYRVVHPVSDPSWIGTIDMGDTLIATPRLSTEDLKSFEISLPLSDVGDNKPDGQVGIWSVEVWSSDTVTFSPPEGYDSYGWDFGSWGCYETKEGDGFTTKRTYEDRTVTVSLVSCQP